MKEIKIQNFVRKYLKIRSHHRNEWDEECAYYSKEESQNDVFSRRVKKQIIQPFLNKFKVVGFSFVKNSNFHSYSDRDSCGLGVHWAYAPSFHVYDLMTYENSIMFQWFDLMELKIKGETLNAVEVDEICLFDGMSEAKCIAKLIKINPKDVVSIPNDYNNTKGRCCKYEVVADIENWSDRIPELSEELVANYQAKMKQADEVKTSEETSDDIVEFNGSQKEFFKSWSEPRNSYTTYILHNSIGDQAYKFIGGLGQKCFKKVDMPNTIQKKAIPEFNTKQEALKNMDRVEGSQCIVKDKVFTLKRVPCSDGYARLKLVE